MSKASEKAARKAESLTYLRKLLKPGDTVYTVLRHVSRSGMSRRIDLYKMSKDGPIWITGPVGRALDYNEGKDGGLVVGGCGMDMGFHLVHSLGYALFGELAAKGTGAKANRLRAKLRAVTGHYMMQGGRTEEPDPTKPAGEWFGAAGYALKHQWM